MGPKVSIIIPTYNRSDILCRAVRSIISQTYDDFELIIIDDASTDDTPNAIGAIDDNRIIYHRKIKNEGGARARNTGMALASGDYIAFLDSDDEWMPEKLEKQVSLMERSEAFVTYTGFIIWNDKTKEVIEERHPKWSGDILDELLKWNCVGTTSTIMVRRECFETVGGFDENMPQSQDWEMWIRLAKEYRFDYIEEMLCRYYVHSGSQITDDVTKELRAREMLLAKHIDLISGSPCAHAHHLARIGILKAVTHQIGEGRRDICRALSLDPFLFEAYVNLSLTLMGQRVFDTLFRHFSKRSNGFYNIK